MKKKRRRPIILQSRDESTGTEVIITDMTVDELFLAIQPDEKSRQEAREWIKKYPLKEPGT
jgi:hypothetical protein